MMRFFSINPKIKLKKDPNNEKYFSDDRLKKLNDIKNRIEKHSDTEQTSRACALKVVDCLRFIVINKKFISYAINKPHDKSIYTYETDIAKKVIRDFNFTSMHFNSYKNATECMQHLNNCIAQFEECVYFCIEKGDNVFSKMITEMNYDEDVGCLEARLQPLFDYVQKLQEYSEINTINDLFLEHVSQRLSNVEDDKEAFEICYKYLGCKIGYPCIIDGTVKNLTYDDLNKQMSLLEFNIPQGFTPEIANQLQYKVITNEEKSLTNDSGNHIKSIRTLINAGSAVIKVVNTTKNNAITFKHIRFWLEQLINPEAYRPVYPLDLTVHLSISKRTVTKETITSNGQTRVNRNYVYNPKTKRVSTRQASKKRGQPSSNKKYTKKTSVTWIPKNGKTALFGTKSNNTRGWSSVGLIFDEKFCHQKDLKYISSVNQATNRKAWVGISTPLSSRESITPNDLFYYMAPRDVAKLDLSRQHNERLYGLSARALTGVVSIGKEREQRLTALIVHQYIQSQMGNCLDLQLYEIDSKVDNTIVALDLHNYSDHQIWDDVLRVLLMPGDIYQQELGSAINLCKLPAFDPNYFQESLIKDIHRGISSTYPISEYILALQFILTNNHQDLTAMIKDNQELVIFIKHSDIRKRFPSLLDIAIRMGEYNIAESLLTNKIYCEERGIAVKALIEYQQFDSIDVLNKFYSTKKTYTNPLQQYIHIYKKNIIAAIIERNYIFVRYYFQNYRPAEIVTILSSWSEIHDEWSTQSYMPDTHYLEKILLDAAQNELIDYNFFDKDTGKTALHLAFINKQYPLVKSLLYKKSNPFLLDHSGEMAFMNIINSFNHDDVTALLFPLIKYHSDFITSSNSAKQELSCVIHEYMNKQTGPSPECYKILYECIELNLIDITTVYQQENSWLQAAMKSNNLDWHKAICKHSSVLLLTNIANANISCEENPDLKKTVFDTICLLTPNDMKQIGTDLVIKTLKIAMSFLKDSHTTWNLSDKLMDQIRMIMMHLITMCHHEKVFEILKTYDLLHPTNFSVPLINILIYCSDEQKQLITFLRRLIISEYEYNGTPYVNYVTRQTKETPLHIALQCHNDEIAKTLLVNHANISKCDADGVTPFLLLVTVKNRKRILMETMEQYLPDSLIETVLSDNTQAKEIMSSANMKDSDGNTFTDKLKQYNFNRLANNMLNTTRQPATNNKSEINGTAVSAAPPSLN